MEFLTKFNLSSSNSFQVPFLWFFMSQTLGVSLHLTTFLQSTRSELMNFLGQSGFLVQDDHFLEVGRGVFLRLKSKLGAFLSRSPSSKDLENYLLFNHE